MQLTKRSSRARKSDASGAPQAAPSITAARISAPVL
jgi:hypothetical protein